MNIIDLNDEFDENKLLDFCRVGSNDKKMPAAENMDVDGWEEKPNTLLHAMLIQRRFDRENRAGYLVAEKDGKYIAGSGFYPLEADPNICIIAVRTYVIKSERGQSINGFYLMPKQVELAAEMKYKSVIFTFNEYNLWLKRLVEHGRSGKQSYFGHKIPESHKNWLSLDWAINIQYTKQWCLYKHIDDSYDQEFKKTMESLRFDQI